MVVHWLKVAHVVTVDDSLTLNSPFSFHQLNMLYVNNLLSLYSTATQNFHIGALRWSGPPTPEFRIGNTNMLVSKNTKICFTPYAKPKICALPPTPNANASQWNIGCVGSQTQNFRVGHFIFFVLISFAFGSQRKPSFQWNMGFTLTFCGATYRNSYT